MVGLYILINVEAIFLYIIQGDSGGRKEIVAEE